MQNLYQLYSKLNITKHIISDITSNTANFYYRKVKPKMKFGKPQPGENNTIKLRHLNPPAQKLKIIQSKICDLLQKIELPYCMYGAVEGSNNIINALQHIESKFFLTIDLKDFFTRISNYRVHGVFIENGFPWDVARILTKLTTHNGSLPQGAPSSPVLANLAFSKTAHQLETLIKAHKITFTVFLDDLVFSSKNDFKYLIPQILEIIRTNKFFPHNKKIHYRQYTCEVTGLIVGNGKLKLVPKMKQEALQNPRIKGYAQYVEKLCQQYLLTKILK